MFSFIKNKIVESFQIVKDKLGFKKANFNNDDILLIEKALFESNFGASITKEILHEIKSYNGEPISWEELVYKKLINLSKNICFNKNLIDNSLATMLIGINGSGKTTTTIKISRLYKNLKPIVIAADTFRAAAQDQIVNLCQKYNIEVFHDLSINDPSAMVYKGCEFAIKNNYKKIIIDTAGRIHSSDNLIKELIKIQKIAISKTAPHSLATYLVLDSLQGNSLISQVENFKNNIKIDGIILTKLDAGVKPGIIYSIIDAYKLPIVYLSYGQHETDLLEFDIESFTQNILGIN